MNSKYDEGGFKKFVELVYGAKNKQGLEDFLTGITTQSEREILAHRLEIVERLLKDQPQHQIATDLGVGVATVSRGAKELANGRFKILN